MTNSLTCAIIGHLVGDYLLQNDWMAQGKKKSSWICSIHCIIWAYSVCLFANWCQPWSVPLLFALHFVQDRWNLVIWWMKLIGQKQFMQCDKVEAQWHDTNKKSINVFMTPGLGPWSIIVVDNVWHIVTIYAVWRFLI